MVTILDAGMEQRPETKELQKIENMFCPTCGFFNKREGQKWVGIRKFEHYVREVPQNGKIQMFVMCLPGSLAQVRTPQSGNEGTQRPNEYTEDEEGHFT